MKTKFITKLSIKNILIFLQVICLYLTFIRVSYVNADEKIVKVAFIPEMYGFYTMEENGGYSGYNYDYLMNASQHTDWILEFVEISEGNISASLAKAEELLLLGEIDLLGPYAAESPNIANFEIGERNVGVYRYNLFSARNNYAITQDNYFLNEDMKVGLVELYQETNTKFLNLLDARDLIYNFIYLDSQAIAIDSLLNEEVDAIINLDMSSNSRYLDYLTTVDRIPFYFVSTKGNTKLIDELDEAIRKVEIIEPNIHQNLLEKYFGIRYEGEFLFTEEEKIQFEQQSSFKVGLLKDNPPYQYINEAGENAGITVEILEKLEDIINFPFEIVWLDSVDELVTLTNENKIDMVGSLSLDYELADRLDVTFTNSYISSGVYWLRNIEEVENPDILYHYVSSNIPFYHDDELTMIYDIETAIKNMSNTGEVSIFCDRHISEYFISSLNLHNIETQAVSNVLSEVAFGVVNHIDESLIGTINRAILFLDAYELDEIIFRNTTVKPEYTLNDLFLAYALEILITYLQLLAVSFG